MAKKHMLLQHIGISISRCNDKIDAVYIKLRDVEIVKSKEIADGDIVIDLDKRGDIVGIEMLEPVNIKITKKLQKENPGLAGININALQNAFQFA